MDRLPLLEPDWPALASAHALLGTDPTLALVELRKLAECGSSLAMVHLGWALQSAGPNRNFDEAEKWLRQACELGQVLGIYYLGQFYLAQSRYVEARTIFEAGCSLGYLPAMYCLGQMYLDGIGVESNAELARALFERASSRGHVFSTRALAKLFMSGRFGFSRLPLGLYLFCKSVVKGSSILVTGDFHSDKLLA